MGEQDWFDRDYYAVLGVPKDADEKEIRKAYRKLARKWHPDQNPGDDKAEAKFKEIGEAFAVLNDKEQRERYDAIRQMASGGARFRAPGQSGAGGFEDMFGGMYGGGAQGGPRVQFNTGGGGAGFEDILSSIFGGGAGASSSFGGGFPGGFSGQYQPEPQKGGDLSTSTKITFKQAFEGETLTFNLDGRPMKVRIPAGVRDGQKIKLAGKGQPGVNGGPAGDLVVQVAVESDPSFSMDKDRLRVKLPITYPEAALGAKVDVPLPDGTKVSMKVPAGTSSGAVLRLKGRGVKKGSKRGDVMVDLVIVTPKKMSDEQEEAVEDLKKTMGDWNPRKN
ncbi:MAG: J domain-containing protein [Scrofimicrobium sp.]